MKHAWICGAACLLLGLPMAWAALPSEAPMAPTQEAFAALDRRMADLDAEEAATKRELGELTAQLKLLRARTLEGGRAYYKMTRSGFLPIGAGFEALLGHANRVGHAKRGLRSLQRDEKQIRGLAVTAARRLDALASERRQLADRLGSLDAARQAMATEASQRQGFEQALSGESGRFAAIEGTAVTLVGRSFAAERGRLLFPLDGRGTPREVRRDSADGPGLELRTAPGTGVRAVFPGHVAFADRYGPYGRLVLIDHGEHYYTVYANLSSFTVAVGDQVDSGQKLGVVGDEGAGPMLYFEVRHRTETVAPTPWLGL